MNTPREKDEIEVLSSSLQQLTMNTMIKIEVMAKRREGKTVEQACREVSEEVNYSPDYIRNIYYKR